MQIDAALQMDRPGEELPGGHHHASATRALARGDGVANGVGRQRGAVRLRAVTWYRDGAGWELRRRDPPDDGVGHRPGARGLRRARRLRRKPRVNRQSETETSQTTGLQEGSTGPGIHEVENYRTAACMRVRANWTLACHQEAPTHVISSIRHHCLVEAAGVVGIIRLKDAVSSDVAAAMVEGG